MIEVTAAIIQQNGRFLICQRPEGKTCEFLWEFPGGKFEAGETGEQCLIRECQEELGVNLIVGKEVSNIIYEYPNRTVHLHFYLAEIASGELTRKEHNAFSWISLDEIADYSFCPADAMMLMQTDNLRAI